MEQSLSIAVQERLSTVGIQPQFGNYTGGEVVAVTITPNSNTSFNWYENLFTTTAPPIQAPATGPFGPFTTAQTFNVTLANATAYEGSSFVTVWAVFQGSYLSVTASGGTGASVNLTNVPDVALNAVAPQNIIFDFTAQPGYSINTITITGFIGSSPNTITQSVSANGNYASVTIPKNYVFTGNLNFTANTTVSATVTVPNAGVAQAIANGATATLSGSSVGPVPAFTNWSCVSSPSAATQPFAKASAQTAIFTTPALTVSGTYVFQYRVSNTARALTTVTVKAGASAATSGLAIGRACQTCHTGNGVPNGASTPTIYAAYSSSTHNPEISHAPADCSACHTGTTSGGHPGTLNFGTVNTATFIVNVGTQVTSEGSAAPGAVFCTACHTGSHMPHNLVGQAATCAGCHTRLGTSTSGTGDAHGIQKYTNVTMTEAECTTCHITAAPTYNTTFDAQVANYPTSIHANAPTESSCAGCHGSATGSPTASVHPANGTFSAISPTTFITSVALYGGTSAPQTLVPANNVFCSACHNGNSPYGVPAHVLTPLNAGVSCAACHTDANGLNAGTGDAHDIQALPGCTQCHSIAQPQVNSTLVNDNSGVRSITNEFTKWSHHVTGRAVQNSDCAACHMEGKVSGTTVSVDANYHMADGYIHLRNCNTTLVGNQSQSYSANIEAKSGNPAVAPTQWVSELVWYSICSIPRHQHRLITKPWTSSACPATTAAAQPRLPPLVTPWRLRPTRSAIPSPTSMTRLCVPRLLRYSTSLPPPTPRTTQYAASATQARL